MIKAIYERMVKYSTHPRAPWILGLCCFAESWIFPLPPDPLLATMILARPSRAWFLAGMCTLTSVAGGVVGYELGHHFYHSMGSSIIQTYGLEKSFGQFQEGFHQWGFWIIVLKGLTPIPFKLVTIASGAAGLPIGTFLWASLIARSSRFFILSALLWKYGEPIRAILDKHIKTITLGVFALLLGGFFIIKWIS